jgi:hypothetical protein
MIAFKRPHVWDAAIVFVPMGDKEAIPVAMVNSII